MQGTISSLSETHLSLPISPLWNNIFSSLLTVLYVKLVMESASKLQSKFQTRASESRKFIHVCAGCWILFWPLFDVGHWSWRLNVLVPTVMSLKLVYKGLILADPMDVDVRIMSRSSSPSELLYGPLQFSLFMIWLGMTKFMTREGAVLMAAVGIGDGIAPIIGSYYGNISYRFPFSSPKSIEGSFFGVFLGTMAGSHLFLYCLGLPMLTIRTYAMCAAIATVAEATAPESLDNVLVPMLLHFSWDKIASWRMF